jgi:hypothetical protein
MTSMVQQLMAGYDAEAGRRCALQVRGAIVVDLVPLGLSGWERGRQEVRAAGEGAGVVA